MQLQLITWPEVETYLARSKGIIVPIGSTEQHGPMGLVGTDALCAEIVAGGIGDQIDALVAPTFSIGMAQHHLGFPGSMTFRPSTLIAVLRDAVTSLVGHGFRRIYFINGHGGNVATVQAAFAEIYAEYSLRGEAAPQGLRCKLANWFTYPNVMKLARDLYGDAEGSHATPSEISLTWYAYPETAQKRVLDPARAPDGHFTDAADYRATFPDGRMGADSSLANIEDGKRLFDTAVADGIADYKRFLEE
ncbi:MAG: creatininase family protein [Acidobacteriota bacterium]|nr:creatininase family protein [Acidobacteriota bacterium]